MGILNKLMKEVPLDYQLGYSDGFDAGIKFYKDSLDSLYKFMSKSAKLKVARLCKEEKVKQNVSRS